jgi:hypothetical protein
MATYLVASYTPGYDRNDATLYLGVTFTATSASVDQLGVMATTGNTGNRTIYLLDNSSNVIASVTVDLTGSSPGTFYYGNITPVALTGGNTYRLAVYAPGITQSWANQGPVTINAALGSSPISTFSTDNVTYYDVTNDYMYAGVDMREYVAPGGSPPQTLSLLGVGN